MILLIILMVLFDSMLFRPVRHYYGGWFGYRPHHHHHYGYGPMGYRPMHGHSHHGPRGPMPGHRF